MNPFKIHFSESKDQAVPFALPALRSYKQNLLFPELGRESSEFVDDESLRPHISPINGKGNQIVKRNSARIKVNQNSEKVSNQKSQKPLINRRENFKLQKNDEIEKDKKEVKGKEGGVIGERKKNLKSEFPKKIEKNQKNLNTEKPKFIQIPENHSTNEPPKTTQIIPKDQTKTTKDFQSLVQKAKNTIPSTILNPSPIEKTNESRKNINPKHLNPKPGTSYFQMRSRLNPNLLTNSKQSDPLNRSESESSKSSLKVPPKTPETFSHKFGETKAIPEYIPKRARASATRSVSRRRNPRHFQDSLFDLDPHFFKMSDLSIAPLL